MTTSDEKIQEVGKNIQEKSTVIWNAANSLYGAFKPHEYGLVILPMAVIKRFHDCLLLTHDAVVELSRKLDAQGIVVKDGFLKKASGYQFYNTSKFTFQTLIADPENIEANFKDYLNGFSDNVSDILSRMNFYQQIDRMVEAGLLFQVISDFSSEKADMDPRKISAVDFGYIFEDLVRRFSESYDEEAGAHFTSRDIVYLMCDLLVDGEDFKDGIKKTIYDQTMGTSQMLTCMEERLKQLDSNADVTVFGQELNPFTFGVAKADMLIRGGDPDNMQFGDTLSDDKFKGYQFDYCISNPPFGIDWKREAKSVEAEAKMGDAGRFGAGLPSKSDGQMLFLQNGIAKLKEDGRMAIIQNGSSLFTGDAGSGPSEIRRRIIENDWLDAIVQLPNDAFMNTGIATYIWLISKEKPMNRRGKVQLIDASKCYEPRRKSIGSKRVDITDACRDMIVEAYGAFENRDYKAVTESGNEIVCKSKIMDSVDLGYYKVTVESPMLNGDGKPILKKGKMVPDTDKRDTETIPLDEDIDAYIAREVKPYNPDCWVDESKTKIGYEIPFTRVFYEYKQLEPADQIAERIKQREKVQMEKLQKLFGDE
ncbi:type I restriction-modification system subunit M [Galactobacillus timonensis]|uniref:type I restriction-modification system subunit M n=1 Tax=Galactobacillus timonensis TaxID=2041840 RepID=UPI000C85901A|nr:class I SAM-dependent DNA methyltransferase [Galactobacillus timonensis]